MPFLVELGTEILAVIEEVHALHIQEASSSCE